MTELKEIRNEMLSLHKTLLEIEKANYESEFGKTTPNQLLQLLFDNERFEWLRTISKIVVDIDEAFANKNGVDEKVMNELFAKVGNLFGLESDEFEQFNAKYQANLDTESSVSNHHKKIQNLLSSN